MYVLFIVQIPYRTRQRWEANSQKAEASDNNTEISNEHYIDEREDYGNNSNSSIITKVQNDSSYSDAVDTGAESVHNVHIYSDTESDSSIEDFESGGDSDKTTIEPLYENCPCSIDEAVADIVELYVNDKWTKKSLSDLLMLLQKILPRNNIMPKTVFKLFKHVEESAPASTVIKHYYCQKCLSYNSIDPKIAECSSCTAKKQNISFFFEIDVRDELKYMFEYRDLGDKLLPFNQRNDGVITDITDGTEYIRVNAREDRQKYDLTLILNTDGVALAKTSKSPCWPVMATIDELPDHLR